MGMPKALEVWHRVALRGDVALLDELLADEVVFHSPVVHTPQEGKAITKLYLSAAFGVFAEPDGEKKPGAGAAKESPFRYVREVIGERDAVLEFMTEMDGIVVNGVDMIRWNDDDQIVDFKVLIRPLKAVNKVHAQMAGMLEKLKG